jgi:phosphoribosylaminoimidazole-succinocarboxamide synthase
MKNIIGKENAEKIKEISLIIYNKGADYARKKGIIIADTKFEFGMFDDKIILVDEVLTPDSSRFWPANQYEPGKSQPSFDKQYVRDYLTSTGWDKNSTPPHLPDEVVSETQKKYQDAYEKITDMKFVFSELV